MSKIFKIGEKYTELSGHIRDDFINELLEMRNSSEQEVVLDFTGVKELGSIALAAIGKLQVQFEKEGRSLVLQGLNERLLNIFQISGLDKVLQIRKNDESN